MNEIKEGDKQYTQTTVRGNDQVHLIIHEAVRSRRLVTASMTVKLLKMNEEGHSHSDYAVPAG
jgi:hypothetical protein